MTNGLAEVNAHPRPTTARKPAPIARISSKRVRQLALALPTTVIATINPTGRNASVNDIPNAMTMPDAITSSDRTTTCQRGGCGDRTAQTARASAVVESNGYAVSATG